MFHPDFLEKYVSEGMKNNGIFIRHDGSFFTISPCFLFDEKYYKSLFYNKYCDFKVAALPLLRVIMRSCYNFSDHKRILFRLKPSNIDFKSRSTIVAPYFISKFKQDALKQFVYTIENHLIEFLNYAKDRFNLNISEVGDGSRKKRYVSYTDWITLAMLFVYYDGRNYKESRDFAVVVPHYSKESSCSKASFKIVLRSLLNWIDGEKSTYAEKNDYEFVTMQLYKIDKIFHFFKINKIIHHRKQLFSDPLISSFYLTFRFTYQEAINLKSILDEEVFKNDIFINECLKCEYPDPLFIFIDFLHTNSLMFSLNKTNTSIVQCANPKLQTDELSFRELVSITKEETLLFIKGFVDYSKTHVCHPKKESSDVGYWKKYFYEDHDVLAKYSATNMNDTDFSDVEYLDYLFEKVIRNLNADTREF